MKFGALNKIENYAIVLLNSVQHHSNTATIVDATSEPTTRSGTP